MVSPTKSKWFGCFRPNLLPVPCTHVKPIMLQLWYPLAGMYLHLHLQHAQGDQAGASGSVQLLQSYGWVHACRRSLPADVGADHASVNADRKF